MITGGQGWQEESFIVMAERDMKEETVKIPIIILFKVKKNFIIFTIVN